MLNPVGPDSKYYDSSDSGLYTDRDKSASTYSVSASVSTIPTFSGSVTILRQPKPESKCDKLRRKLGCDGKFSCWTLGKVVAFSLGLLCAGIIGMLVGRFGVDSVQSFSFVLRVGNYSGHVEGALIYKNAIRFYTPSHGGINNVESILDFSAGEIVNIDHTAKRCFIENLAKKELGSLDTVKEALIHIRDKLDRVLWQPEPPVKEGRLAGIVSQMTSGRTPEAYEKCRENKYPIYSAGSFYNPIGANSCQRACYPHFIVTSNLESNPVTHHLKLAVIECVLYEPCTTTTVQP